MAKNKVDKNSRAYLEQKVANSRHSLLIIVVFTVVNIVLLLTEANSYYLFSAAIPYEITFTGAVLNYIATDAIMGTQTYIALAISAMILGLYLLCWALAKKRPAWYIVAVVLFALDTVAMIYINMDYLEDYILDIVFHVYALYELIQAVIANKKLKALPPEAIAAGTAQAVPVESWERKDIQ